MKEHADGWPELTYRYIEHYYWEPQHLFRDANSARIANTNVSGEKSIQQVYQRLRSQEVPLNYLLNVLLRLAPSSIRTKCLESFNVDSSDPGLSSLTLKTPCDYDSIQPDVHLESATARVFIEVKVKAHLTLKQIEKYIGLHEKLNGDNGNRKSQYVLFLVKPDLLRLKDIEQSFDHHNIHQALATLLGPKAAGVNFGSTTWTNFAMALNKELDQRLGEQSDTTEMLATLIGDFLNDLKLRNLFSPSSS